MARPVKRRRSDPPIVLAYARRYEPQHLVDGLLANASWCDDVVCLDDRTNDSGPWRPRRERERMLVELARASSAAPWCLMLDPDERLQDGAEDAIRGAIIRWAPHTRFDLRLRELWTPTEYRSDGDWGDRWRRRLFHLRQGPRGERVRLDVEIAHLKMIEPENRAARAETHKAWNTWDNRARGFDYMLDEDGLTLAPARPYSPPYEPWTVEVPQP